MDIETRARIEAILGPVAGTVRITGGGYTPAERWRLRIADGATAFAKVGVDPNTAGWIRDEHRWYTALGPRPWLARCLGLADDPDRPALLLEDLSHGRWPPPWGGDDVARVVAMIADVAATRVPGLPALRDERELLSGWSTVAGDPEPFLSLGMCSPAWLDRALPVLLAAQEAAELDGDDLLHFDVRSDNLCLLPDRVVLVDWNKPVRGPAAMDVAFWAPSLRLEGGPLPDTHGVDVYAAVVAGYFASRAGLPGFPEAPRVRWIQRRQLRIALPWAARALGLSPPDTAWAREELARVDRALAGGAITEAEWYGRVEEPLIDAYLASDDPRRQSGKSGDEVDWRWSRELVLDALPPGGTTLLDVGAANGYLVASLARWAEERGLRLEVSGLEISARIAPPGVHVGNVLTWDPPRRYDLVHTGLDYAPPGRRRELVDRIRRDLLAPGGRVVFRPERAGPTDPVAQLRELGLEPDGILEATHPETGVVRRTAWIHR